jgi:hypothetical protein
MTRRITTLLLTLALGAACATQGPVANESLPAWLRALTRELETQPIANPPASIVRYDYRGQVVYYLSARCCDIPSNLYTAAGAIICHPDGGFSGSGDGRCSDFFAQRSNEEIVWRDPRGVSQTRRDL